LFVIGLLLGFWKRRTLAVFAVGLCLLLAGCAQENAGHLASNGGVSNRQTPGVDVILGAWLRWHKGDELPVRARIEGFGVNGPEDEYKKLSEGEVVSTREGTVREMRLLDGSKTYRQLVNRKYIARLEKSPQNRRWSVIELTQNESGEIESRQVASVPGMETPAIVDAVKARGIVEEVPSGQTERYRVSVESVPERNPAYTRVEFLVRRSLDWMPEQFVLYLSPEIQGGTPFSLVEGTAEFIRAESTLRMIGFKMVEFAADKSQSREIGRTTISYLDSSDNDPDEVFLSHYGLDEPVFARRRGWPLPWKLFLGGCILIAAVWLVRLYLNWRRPLVGG
jgi:hypothetical protein